ncbi:MAG: hypothetical protein PUE58_07460 [Lachnospiraceae bacterium]|nr:hypothetical protein [Lachnospiraceae bacterium]
MVKDGWHIVKGFDVFVKDGKITRGIKKDYNGDYVPAFPYRSTKEGWSQETPTVAAFRRDNWTLK